MAKKNSCVVKSLLVLGCLALATPLYAGRSVIVDAEGKACNKGKLSSKSEDLALNEALTSAHTIAGQHVITQAGIGDPAKKKSISDIYNAAPVRGLQELKREKSTKAGQSCVKVAIKAEVVPEEKDEELLQKLTGDGPGSPLAVQVWPEREIYQQGEEINFFLKANKPFYASIVYTDAAQNIAQILPNPYHTDASFEAEKIYSLPSDCGFSIKVAPPAFGQERITVYAATVPLDGLAEIVPTGEVNWGSGDGRSKSKKVGRPKVAEYVEVSASLTTKQGE